MKILLLLFLHTTICSDNYHWIHSSFIPYVQNNGNNDGETINERNNQAFSVKKSNIYTKNYVECLKTFNIYNFDKLTKHVYFEYYLSELKKESNKS